MRRNQLKIPRLSPILIYGDTQDDIVLNLLSSVIKNWKPYIEPTKKSSSRTITSQQLQLDCQYIGNNLRREFRWTLLRLEVMTARLMFCRYYTYLLESSRLEITAPHSSIIATRKELSTVVRVKGHAVDRARVWLVKVYTIVTFSGALKHKDSLLRLRDKRSPRQH